jgi:serine/threonine protein kinase
MLTCLIGHNPYAGTYEVPDLAKYKLSGPAEDLLNIMLSRTPSERLTASELLQHEWFKPLSIATMKTPEIISEPVILVKKTEGLLI